MLLSLMFQSCLIVFTLASLPEASTTHRKRVDNPILSIPVRNFGNQLYTLHVAMGTKQWFNFTISNTRAFTAVAGKTCVGCSSDSSSPKYDPSLSETYIPATVNTSFPLNGQTVAGGLGTENCGFREANGTWWWYNNQKIIVAGAGTNSSIFGAAAGIAGFGQSSAPNATDSIIGEYLATGNSGADPGASAFQFAVALFDVHTNSNPSDAQPLVGDSSGGFVHINGVNASYYSGDIKEVPVASNSILAKLNAASGGLPTQLGSYDWSVQIQSWVFSTGTQQVTGGTGTYATLEAAYPYIILPQAQASVIYASFNGSNPYVVPVGSTTSTGAVMYSDPTALTWSIPCAMTEWPTFYINIGGISIPITGNDLFTTTSTGVCVGTIRAWNAPTLSTAILGSTFFRNAYLVFSANTNNVLNTVGVAGRPSPLTVVSSSSQGRNRKVIIGAVVGGIGALLLILVCIFLALRRWRGRTRAPPSAKYAASQGQERAPPRWTSSTPFSFATSREEYGGVEPWVGEEKVVVTPWTPPDAMEQAFLSPTGTTANSHLPYAPFSDAGSGSSTLHSNPPQLQPQAMTILSRSPPQRSDTLGSGEFMPYSPEVASPSMYAAGLRNQPYDASAWPNDKAPVLGNGGARPLPRPPGRW